MGFTSAEVGLKLNDRIPGLTGKTTSYGDQQQAHSFRNISTGEEFLRILIFRRSISLNNLRNIGGEFRLLKGPFQYISMWSCDLSPRFHIRFILLFYVFLLILNIVFYSLTQCS